MPPARRGRRLRIGLLGGSFNPAHRAHRRLSLRAARLLDLDMVWWLVSPQNPLKPSAGMASLGVRLAQARKCAGHAAIRATAIERALGTRYSIDTVTALRRRLPRLAFVWLMGADNLAELATWRRWPALMRTIPVAIFDRPTYSRAALTSPAARRFARFRQPTRRLARLCLSPPPAWTFVGGALDRLSATVLRRSGGWSAAGPGAGATVVKKTVVNKQ